MDERVARLKTSKPVATLAATAFAAKNERARSGGHSPRGCFEYEAAHIGAFVAMKDVPLITIVAGEATRLHQHQPHGAVADRAFAMVKVRNHGSTIHENLRPFLNIG
jgi:hypothetical protein